MMSNAFSSTAQLNTLKQHYEQMLYISVQQKELLEKGSEETWELDRLLELMQVRQEIIRQIDEIAPLKEPVQKQPAFLSDSPAGQSDAGDKQVYQQVMEEIRHSIVAIQTNDNSCRDRLEKAMQVVAHKLSQIKNNQKAQMAYDQGDVYAPAWFIDKKQ